MSIRIAGQVVASAGSLTAHNEDPNAHPDIRELISQSGGGGGGNAGSADIAKAIENQNKVTDTVDPIYNWLGTQQEYEEQNVAMEHPDWVCFITDDIGNQNGGEGGNSEAKWGAITGDINAQTDLTTAFAEKQDKLAAGEGITIEGNVISAKGGGGSVEVPENVYTQDNLVAGKNVVFEKLETKINGELLGSLNITSDFVASGFSDDNVIVANDPINETSDLQSFEICTSFKLYSTANCGIIDTAGSAGNARWRITLQDGVVRARTMFYASSDADVDIYGNTYIQPGVKYRLKYAYLADTNNGMYGYRLWVLPEGEEFRPDNIQGFHPYVERPYISSTHNTVRLGDNSAGGNAMDGELYLKETYINVNNEKAWEAVTIGGKTKVSVTGPCAQPGGSAKNIGEVYYSQSSLATDNAGALPLFTGETIASANTIYPDFYAWVESHTELQTTEEEYESALTTYGECAKYVVSNGSLRLPKLSNYIKMANTTNGITQGDAGLPNITGNFKAGVYNVVGGAFTVKQNQGGNGGYEDWNQASVYSFDASLSSPVYGNSDTVTPTHTTLYPWVFAYNASVRASTAQTAEFQEGLSGKVDLAAGVTNDNVDYVVESYNDGTNWYRVYKSGWVEQGGTTTDTSNTHIIITFLKPFADVNYSISKSNNFYIDNTVTARVLNFYSRTTTSADTWAGNTVNAGQGFSWIAEGQGA